MFVTYSINRGMYLHTLFFEFNFDTALLNISKRVQRMAGPSRRAGVLSRRKREDITCFFHL